MSTFIPANQFVSYKYLEASSPKKLEVKMLQLQIDMDKPINFTPPIYNNKSNTYETWYLHDYAKDLKPSMENK